MIPPAQAQRKYEDPSAGRVVTQPRSPYRASSPRIAVRQFTDVALDTAG